MLRDDVFILPADLPIPVDDGAYDHVRGRTVPPVELRSTSGSLVRLDRLPGRLVVFIYPRMGRPDEDPPTGLDDWNAIPGARGCTPEACGYRDHHEELLHLASIFGLSTQRSSEQIEASDRLRLPFELLSDGELALTNRLRLPTFEFEGRMHLRRATLVIRDAHVEHVFYPCFPPDRDAERVIEWLLGHPVDDW